MELKKLSEGMKNTVFFNIHFMVYIQNFKQRFKPKGKDTLVSSFGYVI